jgi:quercetin 2,3-dioxygenase
MTIQLRRSIDRGHFDRGWLKSAHTFSFGHYYDPNFVNFRSLRVINEDFVQPHTGFATHAHQNMEIITYVLSGEVTHADTLGSKAVVRPGEIQMMSAGTGVEHSEHNHHPSDVLHLLQIWITPDKMNLKPRYQQVAFDQLKQMQDWTILTSSLGGDGPTQVSQDVHLYTTKMKKNEQRLIERNPNRYFWIQVIEGEVSLGGLKAKAGDALYGANIDINTPVESFDDQTHLLYFDLS